MAPWQKFYFLLNHVRECIWNNCDHYYNSYYQDDASWTKLFDILPKKIILSSNCLYFFLDTWQLKDWSSSASVSSWSASPAESDILKLGVLDFLKSFFRSFLDPEAILRRVSIKTSWSSFSEETEFQVLMLGSSMSATLFLYLAIHLTKKEQFCVETLWKKGKMFDTQG